MWSTAYAVGFLATTVVLSNIILMALILTFLHNCHSIKQLGLQKNVMISLGTLNYSKYFSQIVTIHMRYKICSTSLAHNFK